MNKKEKVSIQLTEKEKAIEEVIEVKVDIEDIHEEETLEKEKATLNVQNVGLKLFTKMI